MIPYSENNDRELKENKFADTVGRRISESIKTPDLNFVEGEVVIFLGFVDREDSKKITHEVADVLEPFLKKVKMFSIAYMVPTDKITIFVHPDFDKDHELYKQMMDSLNEARDNLIIEGKFQPNKEIRDMLEKLNKPLIQ